MKAREIHELHGRLTNLIFVRSVFFFFFFSFRISINSFTRRRRRAIAPISTWCLLRIGLKWEKANNNKQ
jgi:hypothetical protein